MAFASSNRTAIRRIEETTFGTTPATPAFIDTRYTSESLNYSITNITSNEIRSDRMTSDLVQTEADVAGSVDFELSYAAFEDFFIHALGEAAGFTADYAISAATIAATADGFTDSGSGFVAAGITVGDWIRVSGFATAGNNGYFRVKTVAAGTLTVEDASPLTVEALGPTVAINGGKITNNVSERSFAFEKEFGDAFNRPATPTPVYLYFNGVRTCGFTLNVNVGEILTGSFNFQGTSAGTNQVKITRTDISSTASDIVTTGSFITDGFEVGMQVKASGFDADVNNQVYTIDTLSATNMDFVEAPTLLVESAGASITIESLNPPRFTGATTVAAPQNDVMNAVGNVVQVNTDGLISTSCFNTLSITYENNCRPIDCVGTLGHRDIKFGRAEVTGTIGLFFENTLDYQRFLDAASFSFAFHVEDNPGAGQTYGNAYTFNFPYVRYESGTLVSEGLDTNIFFNATFRALVDRSIANGGTGMTSDGTDFAMFSITKYAAA